MSNDTAKWWPKIEVSKWNPETVASIQAQLGHEPDAVELLALTGRPDDLVTAEGNALTTAGLTEITLLLTAGGGQGFTASRGFIGVGATNTAFNVSQTALAGNGNSTTAWYAPLATGPTPVAGAISATATFGTSDGNFVWNEWCWGTATAAITAGNAIAALSAGTEVMWNRAVVALGTKAAGAVWTLSTTITIT